MMTAENLVAKPWHREPWPWLLMAGPALVIVAGFATLWLAINSDDGLVADDYYKRGLAINQTLSRGQAARDLGLSGEVGLSEEGGRVTLTMRDAQNLPDTLNLRLVHPTRAVADQALVLRRTAGAEYTATLSAPVAGRRVVLIEDPARQWRLSGEASGITQHNIVVTPQ